MNRNIIDFRNPAIVRQIGMSALKRDLGTVGAAYFLRQFSSGKSDYTAERENVLKDITLEEIIKNVREIDKQHNLDKK